MINVRVGINLANKCFRWIFVHIVSEARGCMRANRQTSGRITIGISEFKFASSNKIE